MRSLPLKPHYRERVLDGSKRTTLRPRRMNIAPLDEVELRFGRDASPIVVLVERVSFTTLGLLTTSDALADGFTTVDELRREIDRFYPDLPDERLVTIVRWATRLRMVP